jgi:ABC-type microcin C transport system duplicated ATPase subunit YejF
VATIIAPAVDHLSFQVQPGEVVGFLGPNGAGDTARTFSSGIWTYNALLDLAVPVGFAAVVLTAAICSFNKQE